MKILLVHPDFGSSNFGFRLAALTEPLGLEILAAALPEHDVQILDLRCGDDLTATLQSFQPHVVAVTALTPEVYAAQDVLRLTKRLAPAAFTIVGGHHATLLPDDFAIPETDAIILGEGEHILAQLIRALEAGDSLASIPNLRYRRPDGSIHSTTRIAPTIPIDSTPLPRRDLVERHRSKYFFLFDKPDTTMATGRGCPYRCTFCSVWEFYDGRTSMMSPQRVLSELRTLKTDHVTFVDDNFLLHAKREDAIADLIRAEGITKRYSIECRTDSIVRHPELVKKWANVGLYAVLLGLEGSDTMLASVGKSNSAATNERAIATLQDLGILIWGAFIVDPNWDADDFKRLRDYVRAHKITYAQYTVLTPLPGTQLYRDRRHELLTNDYTCFDALHAVLPTRLPREEFYRQYAALYSQDDWDWTVYLDMARAGKVSIADLKRGHTMLTAMSKWQNYAQNDPLLRSPATCVPSL